MKKIIPIVLSIVLALSLTGCMGFGGSKLEGVNIADASEVSGVKDSKYDNNLKGLEKYLVDLKYIPENAQPTEMMYAVIGAIAGDRYNFNVDNSGVFVELYEYDPENLNDDAKRVIEEINKNGSFHVFDGDTENAAFEAYLSYNSKYMLIYTGGEGNDQLKQRKKDFIKAVREFHKE